MPWGIEDVGKTLAEFTETTVSTVMDVGQYVGDLGPEAVARARRAVDELGDMPQEALEFYADPKAYVRKRASRAVRALGEEFADAAMIVADDVLDEVGLGPLADGVAAVAGLVEDALQELADVVCVADYAARQEFWGVVALLVGARGAGLVASVADCRPERIVPLLERAPGVAQVVGLGDFIDLLACAARVAFKLPLPDHQPRQHAVLATRTASEHCAYVDLRRSPDGPAQHLLVGVTRDDLPNVIDADAYGSGWRFAIVNPVQTGEDPTFDIVLEQSSQAQNTILDIPVLELLQAEMGLTNDGWGYSAMRTYRDRDGVQRVVALLNQAGSHHARQGLVRDRTLKWWLWSPKMADAFVSQYYEENSFQRERRRLRLVAVEEWPELTGGEPALEPLRASVVIGFPLSDDVSVAAGFAIDPNEFRHRHMNAIASGMELASFDVYTVDGLVQVAALWHGPANPGGSSARETVHTHAVRPSPSSHLLLEGWPIEAVRQQFPSLHADGYRIAKMATYVT